MSWVSIILGGLLLLILGALALIVVSACMINGDDD